MSLNGDIMIKYTTETLENAQIDCLGIVNSCYGKEAIEYLEKTKLVSNERYSGYLSNALYRFKDKLNSLKGKEKISLLNTNYVSYYTYFPTIYFMIIYPYEDSLIRYNSLKGNLFQIKKEAKHSVIGFPYNLGLSKNLEWDEIHKVLVEVFDDKDIIVFDAPEAIIKKYSKQSLWSKIKRLFS